MHIYTFLAFIMYLLVIRVCAFNVVLKILLRLSTFLYFLITVLYNVIALTNDHSIKYDILGFDSKWEYFLSMVMQIRI